MASELRPDSFTKVELVAYDPLSNKPVRLHASNNSLSLISGSSGASHNRNIAAAATTYASATNSATWNSSLGLKEATIVVKSATAGALQNDELCLVVFNAPSDAVASNWLSDAGAVGQDVQYYMVPVAVPRTFQFTDALTRVDVLPLNDTMRVIVEAN